MHDIRAIRDDPDAFDAALARRGDASVSSGLLGLDRTRREAIAGAEAALAERNAASKEVGAAKAAGEDAEFERLRTLVAEKKDEVARLEDEAKAAEAALRDRLLELPNLPDPDVPDGASEEDNVELRRWGDVPEIDGAREHFDIPAVTAVAGGGQGMDFETAATISGARFVLLRGAVARVHRALAQFMLDTHVGENGLTEVAPPVLVTSDAMTGTDKLPKFGGDSFRTEDGLWLVPTAEVPLTYSVAGKVLDAGALPIRMVAHTLCFRSEAGSAGRDTKGMLRQHQFEKVEMVSVTGAGTSEGRVRRAPVDDGERRRIAEGEVLHEEGEVLYSRLELERMTEAAEGILERLGLPYRTLVLCTGDMGFGARRTHDVEVWLPGQGTYREISSCSTTGDFQARRMNARYRPEPGAKPAFVHTLNGSGLAVGRCLIAVLENGQTPDGGVDLPPVLAGWLGGRTRITPEGVLE